MNIHLDTPVARRLLKMAQSALPELVEETIAICQIPAPTFAEERRTSHLQERMTALALKEVTVDAIGNVTGCIRGTGTGPSILLAAHLDTVFPLKTDLTVQRDGEILRAPSIGDNSSGVAVMLFVAKLLLSSEVTLGGDLILAATVGEEGLGNLRGIRAVMDRMAHEVDYVIAIDGSLGGLVRQGLSSRRFRLSVTTEGGHSWGAFGVPSAIHSLGRIIAQISDIRVPVNPKTTFNVGTITGGSSVNTIAASAEALIDIRSLDTVELRHLEERVRRIISDVARQSGVDVELQLIGDRPTGMIPEDHPLCRMVRDVHYHMGIQTRSYPSSTDGNIPLAMGIPTVTVGVTLGGNGHRTDEYIHTTPLSSGLGQMLLLLLAAQELPRRVR